MPANTWARRRLSAEIAARARHNGQSDPRLGPLRDQLAVENLAEGLEATAQQLRELSGRITATAPRPGSEA